MTYHQPTTAEIASIAAMLAKSGDEAAASLAARALAIWEAADALLNPEPPKSQFVEKFKEAMAEGIPNTPELPVPCDEFLLLMLPKSYGRTDERYNLFREFLRYRLCNPYHAYMIFNIIENPEERDKVISKCLKAPGSVGLAFRWAAYKHAVIFDCLNPKIAPAIELPYSSEGSNVGEPPKPTDDDVNWYFALWRSHPIPDYNSFQFHKRSFEEWYQQHQEHDSATLSDTRRRVGAKGLQSTKRKRKKPKKSLGAALRKKKP